MNTDDIVIVAAARTPQGRLKGQLASFTAPLQRESIATACQSHPPSWKGSPSELNETVSAKAKYARCHSERSIAADPAESSVDSSDPSAAKVQQMLYAP